MAKITTVTNPLTGQPAQVDQLDHTAQQIDDAIARALPGGAIDIALQNKAPAGYGLGGAAKYLTADDDINNIWVCGWYCWDAPPVNCPVFGIEGYGYVTYSMMLVLNKGGNYVSGQVIYAPSGEVLQRMYNGSLGGWQPWEWVNPPMQVGVEYRTTERYQGKPVYTMAINTGSLGKNTTDDVPHNIANIDDIWVCGGSFIESGSNKYSIPFFGGASDNHVIACANRSVVHRINSSNVYVITDMIVILKYTKLTDS